MATPTENAAARPRPWPGFRLPGVEPLAFVALAVAFVVPVWAFGHFPTQDGPMHLETAAILARRHAVPSLAQYFEPNLRLLPNVVADAVLAAALLVFSPSVAERILLTAQVLGLALAYRLVLPARARATGMSLAVFPFAAGWTFHMGFSGFGLGMALYFVALCAWRRTLLPGRAGAAVALGGVALLLALTHGLVFVVLAITLATLVAWRAVAPLVRTGGRWPPRRRTIRQIVPVGIAMIPGLVVVARFAGEGARGNDMEWLPLATRVGGLLRLSSLVAVDAREPWLAGFLAASILVVLAWTLARRGVRRGTAWLAASGLLAAVAILAPDTFGSGWAVSARLQAFPWLLAVAWIGIAVPPALPGRLLATGFAIAGAALLTVRWPVYALLDASLEEYASAARAIAPGSTFLPLQLTTGREFGRTGLVPAAYRPLLHASGLVAVERDAVDLGNYQADTGYFLVRYAPGRNPFQLLARGDDPQGESAPPCVDLDATSPIRVDQVLLWGPPRFLPDDPCVRAWHAVLRRDYDVVFVSRPRGFATVWKRRR